MKFNHKIDKENNLETRFLQDIQDCQDDKYKNLVNLVNPENHGSDNLRPLR